MRVADGTLRPTPKPQAPSPKPQVPSPSSIEVVPFGGYRVGGSAYLFEPAARNRARMIRPLTEVMAAYVPHFGVNHRFDTYAFVGCATDAHRGSRFSATSAG